MGYRPFSLTRLAMTITVLAFFAATSFAQFRGAVQGVVSDAAGGAIPGATVTLTNKETGQIQTTQSSDAGYYRFSNLAPGLYSVSVEREGFKKRVIDNVKLDAETIRGQDVALEAGVISEVVTVEAENVGLETEDGSVRKTITNEEILNLPQVGRDPYELARLTPGVFGSGARSDNGGSAALPNTTGPGGSGVGIFATENQVPIVANGQRLSANNFQVDGSSVNSQTWGGAAVVTPSQESVKEVQVTSSTYSAEDGRNSGATVRVVTQNGTNDYHGSLFFKYNDPGWNAYNRYFGVSGADVNARRRVERRDKTFGGSIGGPLPFFNFGERDPDDPYFISGKDRLFFFFSYEGLRANTRNPYEAWIETEQFRNIVRTTRPGGVTAQVFADPGIAPRVLATLPRTCAFANIAAVNCREVAGGLDIGSPVLGLGQYVPLSDQFFTGGGFDNIPDIQYALLDSVNDFTGDQYFTRIDFQPSAKDQFTVSTFITPTETFASDNGGRSRPMADISSDRLNWVAGFIYNRIFTPTLLNQFRVNVTKWGFDETASNPQVNFGIPRIEVEGLPFDRIRFGANRSEGTPGNFNEVQIEFRDLFTATLGNHNLKLGAEFRRDKNDNSIQGGARPLYSFVGLWNLANDTPIFEAINASPVTGAPAAGLFQYRSNNYAFFVQDDWKARSDLTLNLGLRWEYFGPVKDKAGNLTNLILGSQGLQNATVQSVDQLHESDYNNFGPQIGFAWSPRVSDYFGFLPENKEFVLRGGVGIGYNRLPNTVFLNARGNPPLLARFNICCGTADEPFANGQIMYTLGDGLLGYPANPVLGGGINPATGLPNVGKVEFYGSPQDQDNGEVYRFSLEGQYELPLRLLGTLGYQGSTSRHLVRIIRLENVVPVGNPNLFATFFPTPDVNANFHSLNARLQRRFANGFQFDAVYRWSKSMDQLSYEGPGGPTNQTYALDNSTEWGPSDFDVRHNWTISGIWELPFFRKQNNLVGKLLGGWQISGIWTRHTGFPWTPKVDLEVRTEAGENFGPVRPIGWLGGEPLGNSNENFLQPGGLFPDAGPAVLIPGTCLYRNNYFILSLLPARTPGSCGSGDPGPPTTLLNFPGIGRNVFRGPKYSSVDMTLSKRFGIPGLGERPNLDIRFNFFNVFNNLNLTGFGFSDNGVFVTRGNRFSPESNAGFGEPVGALAGRTIEFQARFSF